MGNATSFDRRPPRGASSGTGTLAGPATARWGSTSVMAPLPSWLAGLTEHAMRSDEAVAGYFLLLAGLTSWSEHAAQPDKVGHLAPGNVVPHPGIYDLLRGSARRHPGSG